MSLSGCRIGFGICGSFCTFDKIKPQIKALVEEEAMVLPVFSFNAYNCDSRFAKAIDFREEIKSITKHEIIKTIQEAERVGPGKLFDVMVIAPCTGNTAAKLVNGITDTPVLMAAKAHLRNNRPLVIGISTNDGLGMNFQNIGRLLNIKNVYFVPFEQDDCIKKPNSLVARLELIAPAIEAALVGKQLEPVLYR